MKTGESKSSVSNALQQQNKARGFFRSEEARDAFFDPATVARLPVQPQLNISAPDDPLEREAEAVADRTVQRMAQPSGDSPPAISVLPPRVQKATDEEQTPQEEDSEASPLLQRSKTYAGTGDSLPPDDDTAVQRRPIFENVADVQDVPLQRHSNVPAPAATPDFSARLQSSKGGGSPLPSGLQQPMEQAMGADFSQVRIHTDRSAADMSRSIQAKAFTHGKDVYFNEGQYAPHSAEGQHLLAHELTHTVQQGGGVRRSAASVVDINTIPEHNQGRMERSGSSTTLTLKNFPVKNIPSSITGTVTLPQGKRNTNQFSIWKTAMEEGVRSRLEAAGMQDSPNKRYRLELTGSGRAVLGTEAQLITEAVQPDWDRHGNATTYQIEHIIDWQIAAGDKNVDVIDNMILLEDSVNNRLGSDIRRFKTERIGNVLEHYRNRGGNVAASSAIALSSNSYTIKAELSPQTPVPRNKVITPSVLTGSNSPLARNVIRVKDGNIRRGYFLLKPQESGAGFELSYKRPNYRVKGYQVKLDISGTTGNQVLNAVTLTPEVKQGNRYLQTTEPSKTYPATQLATDEYAVPNLRQTLRNFFTLRGMSPIEIDDVIVGSDLGIQARGRVLPTIPLIQGSDIQIRIDGDEFSVGKEFSFQDIHVPPPFTLKEAALGVYVSTESGFVVEGRVDFGVNNLGEGFLEGKGKGRGFAIKGEFNFDSKLFDPAKITASYENNNWAISGEIGIRNGKIKGIKSATAKVSYSEAGLEVAGSVEPDIPGIKKTSLSIEYKNEQLVIGGALELADNIPGIQSGSGNIQVTRGPDGEWSIKADGTAVPKIPGIDTSLSISYDRGFVTIFGTANYQKGMLAGSIEVGATNRAVGDDGQPVGDPLTTFIVYGGGSLTLRITPWLAATAGVRFLPNGDIEIRGRIGLPSTVNVFPEKKFDKNLFSIPQIEIPIFAIPLGPKSIGLVATINGGLDFSAGFGPGQLRELYGEVIYNPSRPEDTTLSGGGKFVIPAHAGLKLRADLGLGLSVGFASLTGGIEVAGALGLEGEAAASVNVNWSPATGLELNALGEINVQPKFTFDINLLARATLNLPWPLPDLSKTWRHNLYSFQWGPDMQFGISFPVRYKEGEPFDISADQVQIRYPKISVKDTAIGLAKEIKNRVF